MPNRSASRASRSISSTDVWHTPGIDPTACLTPRPDRTNKGKTSCAGASCVSRTMRRSASVRRRRRGRYEGKLGMAAKIPLLLRLRRGDLLGAPQTLQDLRRSPAAELVRETNPAQLRIVLVHGMLTAHDLTAVHVGDQAE